jgi:hypothetical protein
MDFWLGVLSIGLLSADVAEEKFPEICKDFLEERMWGANATTQED